jgi:hypothetical protein
MIGYKVVLGIPSTVLTLAIVSGSSEWRISVKTAMARSIDWIKPLLTAEPLSYFVTAYCRPSVVYCPLPAIGNGQEYLYRIIDW